MNMRIKISKPSAWLPHNIKLALCLYGWLRGTVVERRSLTVELSLSHALLAADG